jgi:plastocyanin
VLKLAADARGRLSFTAKVLKAKRGAVTIDFTNASPLPHNLTIASKQGTVLAATPTFKGATKLLTVHLRPGRYTFYCSVPGHRAAGMQGTLVVR